MPSIPSQQSGVANVRAFGAIGDGVHDDAPAIQAALDAVGQSGGGEVVVPAGKYRLLVPANQPAALLIRGNRTSLRGKGASSWLMADGPGVATASTILIQDAMGSSTNPVNYTQITDLHFNPASAKANYGSSNPSTAAISATAFEIALPRTSQATFEGLSFGRNDYTLSGSSSAFESNVAGCFDIGGSVGESHTIRILRPMAFGFWQFLRARGNVTSDIFIDGNTAIDANNINACQVMTLGTVEAFQISNTDFVNSAFTSNWPTLWLTALANRYSKFLGCYFDTSNIGVQADNAGCLEFTSCWFSDRAPSGSGGAGLIVNGTSQSVSVANSTFANMGGSPVILNGGDMHRIIGNAMVGIGVQGAVDAIIVGGSVTGAKIVQNDIKASDYRFSGNITNGITIKAGAKNVNVDFNTVKGQTGAKINNLTSSEPTVIVGSSNL